MGAVYILTNQCMPDVIKVGITHEGERLEQRIKDLDTTGVALPFECYYAVEVPDAPAIEKRMHEGLADLQVRPNREFFYATPEAAKSLLRIAEIMGGTDITPSADDVVETPQDQQALDAARKRRGKFNFEMLGIEPGTKLEFKKDSSITCEVMDKTQVKFRDEITSLSNSAFTVLSEMGYEWERVNGVLFWCLRGRTLDELRSDSEN